MSVFDASIKGKRPQNEDYHNVILNLDGKDNTKESLNYYALYDGHGGISISKFLHVTLPPIFIQKRVKSIYPIRNSTVNNIYDTIQTYLKTNYATQATKAGSTCLVAIHTKQKDNDYLTVINTGDSRCVICRYDNGVNHSRDVTKDHKPNSYEEKHRITSSGGKITFDGFDWRINDLSVSRAFGDITATHVITTPDIYKIKLLIKNDKSVTYDKFFVMACDGLWDVLKSQEVVDFVLDKCYTRNINNKIISDTRTIKKGYNIANELAKHAISKGSGDNVTVIVVFLD